MGEPQLPICSSSQGRLGRCSSVTSAQRRTSVDVARWRFSRSRRDSITYFPPIRRGNSAMPLFCAAGPFSVEIAEVTKSSVWISCGKISKPS